MQEIKVKEKVWSYTLGELEEKVRRHELINELSDVYEYVVDNNGQILRELFEVILKVDRLEKKIAELEKKNERRSWL